MTHASACSHSIVRVMRRARPSLLTGLLAAPAQGAVHMIPANFRVACRAIDLMQSAFAVAFPGCPTVDDDPCACGGDWEAGQIVARPEYAYRTAVWWFTEGSAELLGGSCGDLRLDMDEGVGLREPWLTSMSVGTGYHKVSACIFGFQKDAGLTQRLEFYSVALRTLVDPSFELPPDPHVGCETAAFDLTADVLAEAMGGRTACPTCDSMLPYIQQALTASGMNCPLRTAAFLGQVRYATTSLQSLTSIAPAADTNAAGALALLPTEYRRACEQVPSLRAAFYADFWNCETRETNPCQCGTDAEAGTILQRPANAFVSAAWYFAFGSEDLVGDPCVDLRLDADVGLGANTPSVTRISPGTGYYKVSTCVHGFGSFDAGRADRVEFYARARRAIDPSFFLPDILGCSDCDDNYYETAACTDTVDTTCAECTACTDGSVVVEECGDSSDAVCGVAPMTISPTTGYGTVPLPVDLFTETTGTLDDSWIVITRDGTEPSCDAVSESETVVVGLGATLIVNSETVIKVIGCKDGLTPSSAASATVIVGEASAYSPETLVVATVRVRGLSVAEFDRYSKYQFRGAVASVLGVTRDQVLITELIAVAGTRLRRDRRLTDNLLVSFSVRVLAADGTPENVRSALASAIADQTLLTAMVAVNVLGEDAATSDLSVFTSPALHSDVLAGQENGNSHSSSEDGANDGSLKAECEALLGDDGCVIAFVGTIIGVLVLLILCTSLLLAIACGKKLPCAERHAVRGGPQRSGNRRSSAVKPKKASSFRNGRTGGESVTSEGRPRPEPVRLKDVDDLPDGGVMTVHDDGETRMPTEFDMVVERTAKAMGKDPKDIARRIRQARREGRLREPDLDDGNLELEAALAIGIVTAKDKEKTRSTSERVSKSRSGKRGTMGGSKNSFHGSSGRLHGSRRDLVGDIRPSTTSSPKRGHSGSGDDRKRSHRHDDWYRGRHGHSTQRAATASTGSRRRIEATTDSDPGGDSKISRGPVTVDEPLAFEAPVDKLASPDNTSSQFLDQGRRHKRRSKGRSRKSSSSASSAGGSAAGDVMSAALPLPPRPERGAAPLDVVSEAEPKGPAEVRSPAAAAAVTTSPRALLSASESDLATDEGYLSGSVQGMDPLQAMIAESARELAAKEDETEAVDGGNPPTPGPVEDDTRRSSTSNQPREDRSEAARALSGAATAAADASPNARSGSSSSSRMDDSTRRSRDHSRDRDRGREDGAAASTSKSRSGSASSSVGEAKASSKDRSTSRRHHSDMRQAELTTVEANAGAAGDGGESALSTPRSHNKDKSRDRRRHHRHKHGAHVERPSTTAHARRGLAAADNPMMWESGAVEAADGRSAMRRALRPMTTSSSFRGSNGRLQLEGTARGGGSPLVLGASRHSPRRPRGAGGDSSPSPSRSHRSARAAASAVRATKGMERSHRHKRSHHHHRSSRK